MAAATGCLRGAAEERGGKEAGRRVTERVKAFLDEIEAVCRKHGLVIAAEGYDGLDVWPLEESSLGRLKAAEDHTLDYEPPL